MKYKKWEDLSDQIGCNYEWKHFHNRILKPAQLLFPEVTSLSFAYKTTKKPKSKAIEGLDFVVTINKKLPPDNANKKAPVLFPKTPNEDVQLIEDIKHTLLGWGIDMIKIEQLINDPFPFITNKTTRSLVAEKYNRLEYLWNKMDYVSRTKKIKKSKAALFFAAIKNNYESAEKAKEGTDAK